MLVTPNGQPAGVVEKRKIVITEAEAQGRPVWGVEFHPGIQAFEFEEVFQILGDVIRGIAQNARSRKHEAIAMKKVREKMHSIKKDD